MSRIHRLALSGEPRVGARTLELQELLGRYALGLRVMGADFGTQIGVSDLELRVLAQLTLQGATSEKTLVADLAVPRSTLTTLADRLEKRGFVRRQADPNDRRVVLLETTPIWDRALSEASGCFADMADRISRSLSDQEQKRILVLLRSITIES